MVVATGQSLDDSSANGRSVLSNLVDEGVVPELHDHLAESDLGPEMRALCTRLQEHMEEADGDLSDEIERTIREHEKETAAAIRIQSSFRGFRERRDNAARSRPSSFGSSGQAPSVRDSSSSF